MSVPFRIGFGLDLHQWAEGRRLVLGGVEIPFMKGLLGHSDADALTHAVIDALLGALAKGDIGQHFPDTDPAYKDSDSLGLLDAAIEIVKQEGYLVGNVDCTVVADAPKMAPHIPAMREVLGRHLGVGADCVSVKATRTEDVLFPPEKGLLATATVLLLKQ